MKQRQRDALVVWKRAQRTFNERVPLSVFHVTFGRGVGDECLLERFRSIVTSELTEEPPAGAVSRQMIEAGVGRDRLEPSRCRWTLTDNGESFECSKKDRLRDIFCLSRVTEEPDGGTKHHVLIPPDKHLKPVGGGHASAVARPVPLLKNPVGSREFQPKGFRGYTSTPP